MTGILCTLGRGCLSWKYVKNAGWGINLYSVVWILMSSCRFSRICFPNRNCYISFWFSFCRGSCAGISFLTNLTLFTPTVFDLASIYQLSGKHQAHKLLIRHEAQRAQAASVWKAQHSFQRLCPVWTVPVLLSLMIYCIACLASVGVYHKFLFCSALKSG